MRLVELFGSDWLMCDVKDFMDTSRQCGRGRAILVDLVTMRRAATEIIMLVGLSGNVWQSEKKEEKVETSKFVW